MHTSKHKQTVEHYNLGEKTEKKIKASTLLIAVEGMNSCILEAKYDANSLHLWTTVVIV